MEPFTHKFSDVRQLLLAEGIVIQHKPVLDEYRVTVSMASIGEKYPDLAHPAKVEKAEALAYYTPNLRDAYETGLRMSAEFHQQVHLPQKDELMNDAATTRPGASPFPPTQRAELDALSSRITDQLLTVAKHSGDAIQHLHERLYDLSVRLTGNTPPAPPEVPAKAADPTHILQEVYQRNCSTTDKIGMCHGLIEHINTMV